MSKKTAFEGGVSGISKGGDNSQSTLSEKSYV